MISFPYSSDSHSKAEELVSVVLASSSLPKISAACSAIEAFHRHHSPEQSRCFFSVTFPPLICKIFGFEESSLTPVTGWIDTISASHDIDVANAVFGLLSPNGVLMSSISAADRLSLVKYVFPIERLPEWARFTLVSEKDIALLENCCPLFKGRIKGDSGSFQVHLNIWEYYTFWFAYYPVCRGGSDANGTNAIPAGGGRKFRLDNWASSIPVFSNTRRGQEQKNECSLYLRLLYTYLCAYVPFNGTVIKNPYRSSLLQYSSCHDSSVVLKADFFLHTLINFWLLYNDFSVISSTSSAISTRMIQAETPPTPGLAEAVSLFVKYFTIVSTGTGETSESQMSEVIDSHDIMKPRETSLASIYTQTWNSSLQRPFYRFILRTFLFYPVGASLKNVSQVFSLWVCYIEPWKVCIEDFVEFDVAIGRSSGNQEQLCKNSESRSYSAAWQSYVLSNSLFYSSLVMHFIGFAHKFLHVDLECVLQMVAKVLGALASSNDLVELIRKVDALFDCDEAGSNKPIGNNLQRFLPEIREKLKDWEIGLHGSSAEGLFTRDNWNRSLRLFNDGENGGHHLLQLFILRAESELQESFKGNLNEAIQMLRTLKTQVACLWGRDVSEGISVEREARNSPAREEIFKPSRAGISRSGNVAYKGDWMKRPASDDEIPWLVNFLVWVSACLNEVLGLNREVGNGEETKWSFIEVPTQPVSPEYGLVECLKIILSAVRSWLVVMGLGCLRLMRRHGFKINLRILASKKLVVVAVLCSIVCLLRRGFGFLTE